MGNFARKLQLQQGENIFLVTGGSDHTGRNAWYFIRVDSTKIQAFRRGIKSGSMVLETFGDILESGYGDAPSQAAIDRMKQQGYKG